MFNESNGGSPDHGAVLDVLARARPERLKALAESALDAVHGKIQKGRNLRQRRRVSHARE